MKSLESTAWVEQQFDNCQLGDLRRTKRLVKVAMAMVDCPDASLPQQNVQWADLKAAYRFFDNEEVTFKRIAQEHWDQTRHTRSRRCLLISDTSDIDLFTHKATTGLGMLGSGVGRGMQLHNCLMYDCDQQQILGTAGALLYYRKHKPKNETRTQRLNRRRESSVWGEVVDQVGRPPEGTQWIHVFDRGGDNFEAMCHIKLTGCDWVVRASKLNRQVVASNGKKTSLKTLTKTATVLGTYKLHLRSRPGVAARTAKIEVSVTTATVPRPALHSKWVKTCGIKSLTMNVVVVKEVGAPKGVKPIHWVLLTSLPVNTFDEAWQIITDYETRWLIEEYHKVLKTGCSIEDHALRTSDRMEALIGLISVVGVRLLQMKLLGRNQPEAKATTHVPANWLKVLKQVYPRIELAELTVYEFFRELAKLGGFLGRKWDGEPGWQTIWRGYRKMKLLLDGMKLAGAI